MTQGVTEGGTKIVDRLPDVTDAQRAAILSADRTVAAHDALMADIPAMTAIEVGGQGAADVLPARYGVAAWNVERCLFPARSADLLRPLGVDVVLLSEMDSGMARTGQANTTADMAAAMGMHYAYGVEFYEMDLGGDTERGFCSDDFNASGWHGNAILSSVPFARLALIRLDTRGHWFTVGPDSGGDPGQPRVGGRMALAAELPTQNGPVCVVTTHLESNAQAPFRHAQWGVLLDAIDDFAGDMPVVIGGDLNTGNHMPPDYDWQDETLFSLGTARGYDWSATPPGITTRPSLITPHPTRQMKLDWFCARGVVASEGRIVPALDHKGAPLSDHECVAITVGQKNLT